MSLTDNWAQVRRRYAGRLAYFRLTPALYSLYLAVESARDAITPDDEVGRSLVLDAGAGFGPWQTVAGRGARRYLKVDRKHADVLDAVCDLKALPFKDAVFDAVYCLQVLEHDAEPQRILAEFARVTKKGGACVISAPHLSRIHDAPHDYWRFTSYGLSSLLTRASLTPERVVAAGGAFTFALHNVYVGALAASAGVPLLRWIVPALARLTSPLVVSWDRWWDRRQAVPANYVAIGRRHGG